MTMRVPVSLLAAAAAVAGSQTAASTHGDVSASTSSSAAVEAEPALQQVDGTLRHVFSVSFTAGQAILSTVKGLVAQRVARTANGGELEVIFPAGVPYPRGAGSVIVRDTPHPDYRSIFDLLALPPGIPERQEHTLVTSHRHTGRPEQYLIVWRNRNTGEHSVTLFDASNPEKPQPVIARSRAAILGIANTPSVQAADYSVTVWTVGETAGGSGDARQVMVESYVWRPAGS